MRARAALARRPLRRRVARHAERGRPGGLLPRQRRRHPRGARRRGGRRLVPGRAHVHRRGVRPLPRRPVPRGREAPRRGACDQRLRPLEGARRRPGAVVCRPGRRRRRPAHELHRPVAAPREGGAAVGDAGAARRAAPGLGRRRPGARLDVRRRRRLGASPAGRAGRAGRGLQRRPARPRACPTSRSPARSPGRRAATTACVYLSHYDRPQHDRRYAVATDRIAALGWRAARSLEAAVAETVDWYRDARGVVVDARPRRGEALCRLRPSSAIDGVRI